jgi:aryl-alcohol dehydrogenase-like predicted oxidoreductase
MMKTRVLGQTRAEVSGLCLGTMHFGTVIDPSIAYALLDRYFEAGGRFLYTANNYATWVPGGRGGGRARGFWENG